MIISLSATACSNANESAMADTSGSDSDCDENEIIVSYLGTQADHDECAAVPAACSGVDHCDTPACLSALYALCESPALGTACSDDAAPTIVSCNE